MRWSGRLVLAIVAFGSPAAVAAEPAPSPAVTREGAYCTPLGCAGVTGSAAAHAAGFGAAAAATVLLARRRRV